MVKTRYSENCQFVIQGKSGVAEKERVTFFRGSCSFYTKSKLKREIFNDKKSL